MAQGYRSDVYARAYGPRRGPIRTRSISPTRASGGPTSRRPTPQYVERESRNVADDALRAEVLRALGQTVAQPGGGVPTGLMPSGTTAPLNTPQVPIEPVMGNPYAGVEAKIGRFAQASQRRQKGDIAAARRALAGRADPGAAIAGSFNTQAAGMAAELAMTGTSLRNQARQEFATAELERRSQAAKNRFDARSQQLKADATLMESAGMGAMTPSLAAQLEAEGIDAAQYMNNPMGASIALGRARFARRGEAGLPPTAWAQAAQYGLRPPNTYGTPSNFYWALGQAKGGTYGGGTDALELMTLLQGAGLLQGLEAEQ
jgi:hypothetical protein